jgi:hypothetical protein
VDEQVGDLEIGGPLCELLDGIAPVAEDAGIAVDLCDGAAGRRRRRERLVVEPDVREELAPFGGGDPSFSDRDLHRFTGAVVGDRDALGHGGGAPCCFVLAPQT